MNPYTRNRQTSALEPVDDPWGLLQHLPLPTGDPATEWWRAPEPFWEFTNLNGQRQQFYGGAIVESCNCYPLDEPQGQYSHTHDWYINRHGERKRHTGTSASKHRTEPCPGCPGYDGKGCGNGST